MNCAIVGDTLHCDQDDLAAGASVSVHVTSRTTAADCGTLNNTASTTSTNDGSGQASDSIVVECPNLSENKVADAAAVNAGEHHRLHDHARQRRAR